MVTIAHPNTKPALPLIGKGCKQQLRRHVPQGQHAFHTYQVPLVLRRVWDKSCEFLYKTTMIQRFPWISCTTFAWRSPVTTRGKTRRVAHADFLRLYIFTGGLPRASGGTLDCLCFRPDYARNPFGALEIAFSPAFLVGRVPQPSLRLFPARARLGRSPLPSVLFPNWAYLAEMARPLVAQEYILGAVVARRRRLGPTFAAGNKLWFLPLTCGSPPLCLLQSLPS